MSSSTTWAQVEPVRYVSISTNAPPPPSPPRRAVRVIHLCFLAGVLAMSFLSGVV